MQVDNVLYDKALHIGLLIPKCLLTETNLQVTAIIPDFFQKKKGKKRKENL